MGKREIPPLMSETVRSLYGLHPAIFLSRKDIPGFINELEKLINAIKGADNMFDRNDGFDKIQARLALTTARIMIEYEIEMARGALEHRRKDGCRDKGCQKATEERMTNVKLLFTDKLHEMLWAFLPIDKKVIS